MDKAIYNGGARTRLLKDHHRTYGHAPPPAVTLTEATSDLPSFGFAEPYGTGLLKKEPSQQPWEPGQPSGYAEKERRPYQQRLPQKAYQRAIR